MMLLVNKIPLVDTPKTIICFETMALQTAKLWVEKKSV